MKRNIRFQKMWNSFVTLTIWEMESPVISWIFTVPEIPEALFPQILKDLMTGMGNAKRYFETYDGDGEHIYMTGTSAGASLCVYLAAMLKSPELAKAFQVVPNDLKIRALGLASGMYSKKLSETCHRHFWSQLMEILFEITANSMQKR